MKSGRNGRWLCAICGHPTQGTTLCTLCTKAVQTFQHAFGQSESLAHSALQFLEVNWSSTPPQVNQSQPTEGTKRCAICERVKSLSEFYISPRGQVHSYCRPCQSEYNAAHAHKHLVRREGTGPQNKKRSSRNAKR